MRVGGGGWSSMMGRKQCAHDCGVQRVNARKKPLQKKTLECARSTHGSTSR